MNFGIDITKDGWYQKGVEKGIEKGREEGEEKGYDSGIEVSVENLLLNSPLSINKISTFLKVPKKLVLSIKKRLMDEGRLD